MSVKSAVKPFRNCWYFRTLGKMASRSFELFATRKGVKNVDQKKALLLHTAGLNVQDIYFTLTEEGGSDSYQKAKATLNKYFKPQGECSV